MKVPASVFNAALAQFELGISRQFQQSINQFAMGAIFRKMQEDLDEALAAYVDKDGLVDCDALRAYVNAGLAASDGKVTFKPKIPKALLFLGVGIQDITITQAEWDEFFDKTIPSFQSVAAPAHNP